MYREELKNLSILKEVHPKRSSWYCKLQLNFLFPFMLELQFHRWQRLVAPNQIKIKFTQVESIEVTKWNSIRSVTERRSPGNIASLLNHNGKGVCQEIQKQRFVRKMSNESQYTVDSARIAFSVPTIVEVRINIASSPRSSLPISSDPVSRAAFSRYAKRDVIFMLRWKFHAMGIKL